MEVGGGVVHRDTEFDTHDDLEAPWSASDFGYKKSIVKVSQLNSGQCLPIPHFIDIHQMAQPYADDHKPELLLGFSSVYLFTY